MPKLTHKECGGTVPLTSGVCSRCGKRWSRKWLWTSPYVSEELSSISPTQDYLIRSAGMVPWEPHKFWMCRMWRKIRGK